MRDVKFERGFTNQAAGSVLVHFGQTRVLCTAMVDEKVPPYREKSGLGWLTAEYAMLPGSTNTRKPRSSGGKVDGRSTEIQRLIGRSLRSCVDFALLGPRTVWIDCDVLQADGGTRTAAITGGCVALIDACRKLMAEKKLEKMPVTQYIAAVSVGIVDGQLVGDLDYARDSRAEVDMNVVGDETGNLIEVQGTAENGRFSRKQLNDMLDLAQSEIAGLIRLQKQALES